MSAILMWYAYLNFTKKFSPTTNRSRRRLYIAGNILKAAPNSPETNRTNERCIPQPMHSIPKMALLTQGSRKSSRLKNRMRLSVHNNHFVVHLHVGVGCHFYDVNAVAQVPSRETVVASFAQVFFSNHQFTRHVEHIHRRDVVVIRIFDFQLVVWVVLKHVHLRFES